METVRIKIKDGNIDLMYVKDNVRKDLRIADGENLNLESLPMDMIQAGITALKILAANETK